MSKEQLEQLVEAKLSQREIAKRLGISYSVAKRRMKEYGLKSKCKVLFTPELRSKISEGKRRWNRDNPEKLREQMSHRTKSVPCEVVKKWLISQLILFVEEFQPLLHKDRYFAIDIAFPDKRIGIEVNGNQHYNRDGTLTDYYQNRHDLIEAEGWKLYELHYSTCFDIAAIAALLPSILSSPSRLTFDYAAYPKPEKRPRISDIEPNWRHRPRPKARFPRPSAEDLERLVWEAPVTHLAKTLGCSGSAIATWCKELGISAPPRGYWRRRACGMSHEEALVTKPPHQHTPARRITPDILQRIVVLRDSGETWKAIGREVGFHRHHVKNAYLRMARVTGDDPATS